MNVEIIRMKYGYMVLPKANVDDEVVYGEAYAFETYESLSASLEEILDQEEAA